MAGPPTRRLRCILGYAMPHIAPPTFHESYRQLLRFSAQAAVAVHIAFIVVFAGNGVELLAALNVLSVAAHAYASWQSRPGGNLRLAGDVMGLEVGLHAVAATLTIGWDSGFHYLMLMIVPVAMLTTSRDYGGRLAIAGGTTAVYLLLMAWSHQHPPLYQLPPDLLQTLQYGCVVTLLLAFIAVAARYRDALAEAQHTLEREAATDPLTGALNRRRLAQLAAQRPEHQHGAVLLCDLDYFKQVNDRHGHEAGDAVLQAFFQQLQACTREGDYVCRWGGEEFLVLLPHTDMARARSVAQRVRASMEDSPVPLPSGVALQVTVTIGLAHLPPGGSLQSAVQRADQALYRGKAAGRNQVQDSSQALEAGA